jgi:RimJ/RimL family protein N-acetyltransferase
VTPTPIVEGIFLRLRPVQPDDAPYVHRLRTDQRYNAHLSPVTGTVADQRRWIEGYKAREAEGSEIYFVIERLDGGACGLVRLYDIRADRFTWGSWILDENKTPKAALESAILSFGVGFERLSIPRAILDVRQGNDRAIRFYRRFGMSETGADEQDIFFEYLRGRYLADRARFMSVVRAAGGTSK